MIPLALLDALVLSILCESIPLVVGTLDGTVYGVDDRTGEILWECFTGSDIISSSGVIQIVPSLDGTLYHITNFGILEVCATHIIPTTPLSHSLYCII